MNIALNLLYLLPGVVGGTETYAAGLLSGLAELSSPHRFLVFVNQESADWPLPNDARFERIVCRVRARRRLARYAFEQLRLPSLLRARGADLVHSLGYVSPLAPPCPAVVTVHDLNFRAFGHLMPPVRRHMLAFFVYQSVRRADAVVTVSEFSRDELCRAYGLDRGRVAVTLEAPRRRSATASTLSSKPVTLETTAPYFIAFSSTYPNKNIPRLLDAYALARARHGVRHALVLVGHAAPGMVEAAEGVIRTGYLTDDRLDGVLCGAEALLFPSTYEGFGLPVLEAMAAGVPVVASRAASLPEVGGDAALYFDPLSVDEMATQIARVAGDPALRDQLRHKGLRHVQRFSWKRTAEATLAVYDRVAGGRRPRVAVTAGARG